MTSKIRLFRLKVRPLLGHRFVKIQHAFGVAMLAGSGKSTGPADGRFCSGRYLLDELLVCQPGVFSTAATISPIPARGGRHRALAVTSAAAHSPTGRGRCPTFALKILR